MNRKWLAVVGALAFVGCSNEAIVDAQDSTESDVATKGDDVQSALSSLPRAEVLSVSIGGTPTPPASCAAGGRWWPKDCPC